MIFKKPVFALLAGALIISFSSVFVKISQVPSTVSAFYRVFFGCLFLVVACAYKKEFRKRSWKKNLQAVACGLLFALDLFVWHKSIQYVGPGLATVLSNCQVFVLALTGILVFKEKPGLMFIFSVPLAFAGLFLLIGVDIDQLSGDYLNGVWFGLATAFFYSIFLLLLRNLQAQDEHPPVFFNQVVLLMAASLFLGSKVHFSNDSFVIPGLVSLASLVGLGFLSQAVGWVVISRTLPKVRASHAGLILLLQPALSFVWDVLFFDRPTGPIGWIGLTIVLLAIYLSTVRRTARPVIRA